MIIKQIINFIFPRYCVSCNKRLMDGEECVCTVCMLMLPRTDYHLLEHSPLEKKYWGIIPIEKAVSLFHHDGHVARRIIYSMKYWKRPDVGRWVGKFYAEEIKQKTEFFNGIDTIIPIPLSWHRRLKRGYNQCYEIALGINAITGIPICDNTIKRIKNNPSQTTMNHIERKENVEGIFKLNNPSNIRGKHVLIVDDVTTTGSTLLSCAKEIMKAGDVRISILTISLASKTPIPKAGEEIDDSLFGLPLID